MTSAFLDVWEKGTSLGFGIPNDRRKDGERDRRGDCIETCEGPDAC